MRLSVLLLKHRSLVIALTLVSLVGVGLLIYLFAKLAVRKPPGPPAPSPVSQIEVNSSHQVPPVPSRSKPVRSADIQAEPMPISTGKVGPVIIKRRSSIVTVTQTPQIKQESDNATHIQAEHDRLEPREETPADTNDAIPFFAPPDAPPGGISALIESATQANVKGALQAYIRTYYPLVVLDAKSINLLNRQGRAEYERQKAALDKELFDSIRGSISPTPGDIQQGYPRELIDMLRQDGFIEGN